MKCICSCTDIGCISKVIGFIVGWRMAYMADELPTTIAADTLNLFPFRPM